MRIHLINLPHTEVTKQYDWCAYTAKIRKFGNILTSLGHEVFLYAGEQNESQVTEHITVVTQEDRELWFGDRNWPISQVFPYWDSDHIAWKTMNARVLTEINKRRQPGDFIAIIAGDCQGSLAHIPDTIPIEWGVGYNGILDNTYCAFESYSHMHYTYGRRWFETGRFYDRVIPNSFDPSELTYLPADRLKDDYFLYLGRQVPNKGMKIVEEISKYKRVIIAGQIDNNAKIPNVEYRGVVLGEEKAKLLACATAVLVPTIYIEPFGGVSVEAMMSGVPVITTDHGAFTETVQNGVNGFRCRTLKDFLTATEKVKDLVSFKIRDDAIAKFSLDAVAPLYDRWLTDLSTLSGEGWYTL